MASEKLSGAYAKRFKNLNNTKPSSQSKPKKESTSTGSAYGDKMKSDWERQQKKKESTNLRDRGYPSSTNPTSQPKTKKTIGTLEAKEKAKTRSTIEAAFVGNSKSAPPSKEEQERMRRKGSRDAANMYGRNYSGRRG